MPEASVEKVTVHTEGLSRGSSAVITDDVADPLSVAELIGDVPEEESSPKWSDVKKEKMLPSRGSSGKITPAYSSPSLPQAEDQRDGEAPSLSASVSSVSSATVDVGVGNVSVYAPSSDASICTLGGGKPLKTHGSWSEAMWASTIGPRAAGTMLKVPLRRLMGHSKRKSWNSNMESYISALRSVGKHLSGMSVDRVRKLAEKPLPNNMLPKGVFRFAQTLRIDGNQEPLKLTWMWPNEITPLRPPELAVQEIGPSVSVLKENPVILYVPGTPFCVWGKGVHRYQSYLLAKRAEAIVCCICSDSLPPAASFQEGVTDIKAVYKHLIKSIGVDPGSIAIAGDSLGAGMAMLAVPLPSSVCLMSPITDLADQVDDLSDDLSSSTEEASVVLDEADGSTAKAAVEEEEEETGGLGDDVGTSEPSGDAVEKPVDGSSSEPKESKSESSKEADNSTEKPAETESATAATETPRKPVAAVERKENVDYVQRDLVSSVAQYAIGNCCPNSQEVSPYYADLSGLPNMLIQAGQDELFLPQIERFAAKVSAMKRPETHFQFQEYEEMVHCFELFGFCTSENEAPRRALGTMAAFVREHITLSGASESNPLA
ncbi:hypothetical protein Pmar_PMAR023072 [Perkinsus marinus ATCC 50983]|uniref:Alpha/beta hydrolase fold-3 domain-containing protein n=1 Tax=Perkinsus marinus (strain ATCC 50983 / TXsc) TaxID=423536 RepID=C5LGP1_PERM5|nr:hypothetical protein Pmar_PMAR023072 [Perkinsus marinus ATCC 50983]EER04086.1 hypothetical protein Pmar_PMAR023072 [Perkinsus marinus ATCC 50983]|eukprot:XP_002772270.1 hypothetical protein Pmar_PMAR023072 [Perkinsus marinus ATCC 50983]